MKNLILFLSFISANAFAADVCSSVWVYKAYKSCPAAANGLDMSGPGELQTGMNMQSMWLSGGRDQVRVCMDVRDGFNTENLTHGLHADLATPKPVGEDTEQNASLQQVYRYKCALTVRKFPFKTAPSPACGAEDKISYQVGGSSAQLKGEGVACLSCDNLDDQKPEAVVNCLRANILGVIEPKAIELRESDLQAVSKQVARLLNLSKSVSISNLQSTDQLSFFADFLEKYPPPKNQDRMPTGGGGGGGLGTRPTWQ